MKKYENGEYVEMTPEEIATMQENLSRLQIPISTIERLEALEAAVLDLIMEDT